MNTEERNIITSPKMEIIGEKRKNKITTKRIPKIK
jgi:hypothetical protein